MRAPRAGFIYGIRLTGNKELRYVGQTTGTLNRRLRVHKQRARAGIKSKLYDWMRAHDCDVEIYMIEESHDIDAAEISQIKVNRSPRLLNMTDGGTGGAWNKGILHSAETRAKISASKTGKPGSQANRDAVKAAHARNALAEISCMSCCEIFIGLPRFKSHWSWHHAEGHRAKHREGNLRRWAKHREQKL